MESAINLNDDSDRVVLQDNGNDNTHLKQVENPELIINFLSDLVHRVPGKVDVCLSQLLS